MEAAGDGDLHRSDHEQGPSGGRLCTQARGLGLLHARGLEQFEQFVGINNQATGVFYRGPRPCFMASMRFKAELMDDSWRAAVSYVTGAHAFKVGYQDHNGRTLGNFNIPVAANLSYIQRPDSRLDHAARALHVGDSCPRWRYLCAGSVDDRQADAQPRSSLGLLSHQLPAQTLGPTVYTPTRNVTFPAGDLASLNDVTPKLGVAYDLFGNGRTALKASLSKYVEQLTYTGTYGDSANPGPAHGAVGDAAVERSRRGLHAGLRLDQSAAERRVPPDQQPRVWQPGAEHDLQPGDPSRLGSTWIQLGDLGQRAA